MRADASVAGCVRVYGGGGGRRGRLPVVAGARAARRDEDAVRDRRGERRDHVGLARREHECVGDTAGELRLEEGRVPFIHQQSLVNSGR